MKQYIHIYGCLLGLLLATSVRAQVPGRSRLELGRKNTLPTPTVTNSKPQRLLMPLPRPMSTMDRLLTQGQNSAMRDYYRSILIAGPVAAAKPIGTRQTTLPTEASAVNGGTDRQTDMTVRADERMFSNDRLTVSNIYPNPAHDLAEIDYVISGNTGGVTITLISIFGAPVAEYPLDRADRKVRLQTRDLPTGYYFYQLSVEGVKVATKKLLVKHP